MTLYFTIDTSDITILTFFINVSLCLTTETFFFIIASYLTLQIYISQFWLFFCIVALYFTTDTSYITIGTLFLIIVTLCFTIMNLYIRISTFSCNCHFISHIWCHISQLYLHFPQLWYCMIIINVALQYVLQYDLLDLFLCWGGNMLP